MTDENDLAVGFQQHTRDSAPPTTMSNELTIEFPAFRSGHVYIRNRIALVKTINAIRKVVRIGLLQVHCRYVPKIQAIATALFGRIYTISIDSIEINPDVLENEKAFAMRDCTTVMKNLLKRIEFDPHELKNECALAKDCLKILQERHEDFSQPSTWTSSVRSANSSPPR